MTTATFELSELNGANGFVINGIDKRDNQARRLAAPAMSTATVSTT